MDPGALIGISAAALGALGAYLAAARRFSGTVGKSDATELWAESRSIREWSQQRIDTQESRIGQLEVRVSVLEQANADLVTENTELRRENERLRAQVDALVEQLREARVRNPRTRTRKDDADEPLVE